MRRPKTIEEQRYYELLCSVPESAIIDYLHAKLNLYKLVTGDTKLLKRLKRKNISEEVYKDAQLAKVDECRDFFMRGDYDFTYGKQPGKKVIEALDARFNHEVIPTYDETGEWMYFSMYIRQ